MCIRDRGDGVLLALGIGPGLLVLVGRLLGIGIAIHRGGIQHAVLQLNLLALVLLHPVHHLAVGELEARAAAGHGQNVFEHQGQHQRPADQGEDAAQIPDVYKRQGTRMDIPVSLPFRLGITLPTALAAPVELGMMLPEACLLYTSRCV